MPTPVQIKGRRGDWIADVTELGQLVTAPLAYNETEFKELAADDSAYNFYKPKSGQQFVITLIRAKANRQVSTTVDAEVVIYEASSEGSTTVDKVLHQEAMVRGESIPPLPMNVRVAAGAYVNAKTSDASVYMTIMGYYVPKVS